MATPSGKILSRWNEDEYELRIYGEEVGEGVGCFTLWLSYPSRPERQRDVSDDREALCRRILELDEKVNRMQIAEIDLAIDKLDAQIKEYEDAAIAAYHAGDKEVEDDDGKV